MDLKCVGKFVIFQRTETIANTWRSIKIMNKPSKQRLPVEVRQRKSTAFLLGAPG